MSQRCDVCKHMIPTPERDKLGPIAMLRQTPDSGTQGLNQDQQASDIRMVMNLFLTNYILHYDDLLIFQQI